MSKSLGNVLLVRDLLRAAPGEAIRFALLGAHYRKPLDWTDSGLLRAKRTLDRLYLTLRDLPGPPRAPAEATSQRVLAALEDDLNTPKAFAELRALAREANASADPGRRLALKAEILAAGQLLGLLQADPEAWLKTTGESTLASIEIERLVELRVAARRAKNFAEADRIRDRLVAAGVILEDGPEGTRWRLAG
jgi:cysteinyl-tRNA synthetase